MPLGKNMKSQSEILREYIDIAIDAPSQQKKPTTKKFKFKTKIVEDASKGQTLARRDQHADLFEPTSQNLSIAMKCRSAKEYADNANPYYPSNTDPDWIHQAYNTMQNRLMQQWKSKGFRS